MRTIWEVNAIKSVIIATVLGTMALVVFTQVDNILSAKAIESVEFAAANLADEEVAVPVPYVEIAPPGPLSVGGKSADKPLVHTGPAVNVPVAKPVRKLSLVHTPTIKKPWPQKNGYEKREFLQWYVVAYRLSCNFPRGSVDEEAAYLADKSWTEMMVLKSNYCTSPDQQLAAQTYG